MATIKEMILKERELAASAFSGNDNAALELINSGIVTEMKDRNDQYAAFKGFIDGIDRVLLLIQQQKPVKSKLSVNIDI